MMNERIRKLAEQAGIVVDFGESPYSELSEITKRKHLEVSEKFAELIIQECVNSVNCYEALNILDRFGIES